MATQDGIFFSSPPSADRFNPSDEVLQLIDKAQSVVLSPAIAACLQDAHQRRLFMEAFARQIELLKSRSQAFEDAHVTVYDKVLLNLTRNGNDLDSPHAIQYFCEEFLGIDTSADARSAEKALDGSIAIRNTLEQGKNTRHNSDVDRETDDLPQACREEKATSSLKIEPSVEQPYPTASPDMEPKLTNLWNVYERAKADYLVVANLNNDATARAARFLRDTAENILSYLEDKTTTDPIMTAELQATYRMAKEAVESLRGGKKRKFDVGDAERGLPGARRGYGYGYGAGYGGPQQHLHIRYGGGGGGGQRYGSSMRRSRSPIHYRGVGGGGGGIGGPPSYPAHAPPPRGPSSNPFGYSRPVDSYHPY